MRDAFRREAGDDVFAGNVLVASKNLSASGYRKVTGGSPAAPHGGSISGNADIAHKRSWRVHNEPGLLEILDQPKVRTHT